MLRFPHLQRFAQCATRLQSSRLASTAKLENKMRSVVCYAPKDYRLEEGVYVPEITEEEVLIRVTRVGICAGDSKCWSGAPLFWDQGPHGSYCQPPVVPGHEFIGEVAAIGDIAAQKYGLQIGDQAIAEQVVPCGSCRYCHKGDYNICMPGDVPGLAHDIYGFRQISPGAMATYMKYVKNSVIHKVPSSIPPEQAVFIEPLSCAVHAVNRANIQFNDVVVISGAGPIGCAAAAAAKMHNPKAVVVVDLLDWKLEIAKRSGADYVINAMKENAVDAVLQLTGGYGCQKYIELAGVGASIRQGLDMLERGGTLVNYAVFKEKEVSADWTIISDVKELTIKGGHLGPGAYPVAIRMLAEGLLPNVDEIVTHKFPLHQYEDAIKMVDESKVNLKVTIDPQA